MKEKSSKLEKLFGFSFKNTTVKTEIFAGIATFLAMAYILVVNPNSILWEGAADARWASVFIATALGAVIGTLLMAFVAKMPLAQAPGMGLNSMIGSVIGGAYGFAFSYGNGMMIILVSGLIFLLLSIIRCGKYDHGKRKSLREIVFDGMPKCVKKAIPVGIGLFIAFIGLQDAGIIVTNEYTLVDLIDLTNKANWAFAGANWNVVVCLVGLVIIAVLDHYNVKGSVVYGILGATILAIPLGVADLNVLFGKVDGITWKFWHNFSSFFSVNEAKSVFLSVFNGGFKIPDGSLFTVVMLVITFAMIDMFDTMGSVIGCATNADLLDEDDKPLHYNEVMLADSIATVTGSLLGTSTVTTFVESGTGVAEGGRSGLTAFVCAIMFFLAIFLLPLFAFIPGAAAASALLYVGVLMMKSITDIDFKNVKYAMPAFLTIIMMPLAYSITDGIGIGLISYVIINLITYVVDLIKYASSEDSPRPKFEISVVSMVITILFLIYFLVPITM